MGELQVLLGKPVGEIKIGDKTYTAYKLKLNDFAELEAKYNRPLQDIFEDQNIVRSVGFILDVLYMSLRKGDASITREYIGEYFDLTSDELREVTQDLISKIIAGVSASDLPGAPKKGK